MKRWIIILPVLIVAGLLIRYTFYTVPAGQAVVLTQFGKPIATITEPGLQWKLPGFLQQINRLDIRTEIFNSQPIQLLLGDKNPIIVTSFIAWKIKEPLLFFQSLTQPDRARQKLTDMVVSAMGATMAQYTLDDLINVESDKVKLGEMENTILASSTASAQQKYGIEILKIGFRRMIYPSIVAEAVYNRMRAEREKEARRYRAEGMEAAAKIQAAADREATNLMSEAYREAEIIRGQGDRDAARIYADAYAESPEFFKFLKSLDLFSSALNEKTTLILSADPQIFSALQDISPSKPKP